MEKTDKNIKGKKMKVKSNRKSSTIVLDSFLFIFYLCLILIPYVYVFYVF